MLSIDIEAHAGDFRLAPAFTAGNEFVVLFGPSGCGKSLTLRATAGLLRPDAGRIELPGGIVAFDATACIDLPPQDRGIGYVVQDLALFPHMTASQNVAFGLGRWPKERQRARVRDLLELLGLTELADRRPRHMSGGQQQRVALARALAAEPALLLLDEPFSALDAPLRSILRREVAALRRRLALTVLFVTHDLSEVYALADRLVVYEAGRVLEHGLAMDVLRRARSRRVAELVEVRNIIPGRVEAYAEGVAVVRTPWFIARVRDAEVPIRGDVYLCIRPEHIIVEREGREHHGEGTALETEIVEEVPMGNTHRLFMKAPTLDSDLSEPYIFEVDVPAHPYQVLDIPSRRSWRISLAGEHTWLIPREV